MADDVERRGSCRILIVEDELLIAHGLARRLGVLGYTVAGIVSTGADAVEQAASQGPDLILMDIVIKGEMDGIEAAKRIYSEFGIPVVFLTAYADEETVDRAEAAGPYGYILKPYQESALNATIRMALRKHQELQFTQHLAGSDPLTGLLNRRQLDFLGSKAFEKAVRFGESVSVVVIDIDRFKSINDTFGHAVGDEAIRLAATASASALRKSDLLARYGGEEFVALLSGTSKEGARVVSERIRSAVAATELKVEGRSVRMTVSIGISCVEGNEDGFATLFERADRALYRAKAEGRDRVVVG